MRTLRPASTSESDAEVVGRLMLDAFPETFARIFGERDHEAARAVGHGLRAFGSLPNAWLAEDDGECEGLVLVRWGNGSTPAAALRAFLAMERVLGPWRALCVAFHIPPLPPHWLHEHEAYISGLAVPPTRRRRGHGSALLAHVIDLARARGYRQIIATRRGRQFGSASAVRAARLRARSTPVPVGVQPGAAALWADCDDPAAGSRAGLTTTLVSGS